MAKNSNKDEVPVPCGKCPLCTARRTSAWSFRLMQEEKNSISSQFVTLTYDTKHVPITDSGYMTIKKRDLQLFFKKLRKENEHKIKYYAAGEYGSKTKRPHYHIILFNCRLETIQPAWGLGEIHYGSVSGASIGYTLKYISKPRSIPVHRNDDRTPEFSLMSKGIGKNYITSAMERWHKDDLTERMYCNTQDNKKISMPRYYKDKIYDEVERDKIKNAHVKKLQDQMEKDKKLLGDNYDAYMQTSKLAAFQKQIKNSQKTNKNEI